MMRLFWAFALFICAVWIIAESVKIGVFNGITFGIAALFFYFSVVCAESYVKRKEIKR
jgi:hypothetical protein